MMKKTVVLILFAYCLLPTAYSQVEATKATAQKTIAGMGGVFMNYEVGLANSSADSLTIDSVKTIADKTNVNFYFNKTEKAYLELSFGYSLTEAPKCRTCPDVGLRQVNFTKGVRIYYKKGKKKSVLKVKKFKQLDDKLLP